MPRFRRTFTVDEHWRFIAEFARWECAAGGPDPHMVLSGEMSRNLSLEDRIWRGGCYISVYNSPYAEVIWREWPWERVYKGTQDATLLKWLTANFHRIMTRRERRCVRRPEWMLEYLKGYAKFARIAPALFARLQGSPEENFEVVWDAALQVPRLGRYVAIKLLEYYRRYCGVDIRHPDIRPVGGRSPREMLRYLWPEHLQVAEEDDSDEVVSLVNKLVCTTQERLKAEFGVSLDMFQLQVMLCDYKQSWKGLRQYPGRSIDSEMVYALDMEKKWETRSEIWPIRAALFPQEHLGEKNGWSAVREDIAAVLGTYGYTWSDLLFDYKATKDLTRPALRMRLSAPNVVKGQHQILGGQLYQSGNWKRYSEKECRVRIQQLGLTGVINLWTPDPRLEALFPWCRQMNIPDGKTVPVEALIALVREAVDHVRSGGIIVSMCHAGRNRSGLVSALIVRELMGYSGQQAMEWVRAVRPRAIANAAFEEYLCGLGPKWVSRMVSVSKPRQPGYLF